MVSHSDPFRAQSLTGLTLDWSAPTVGPVAIQGYTQASPGQAFVVNLSRDPRFLRGLEGFALALTVDGVQKAFRPELCGTRTGGTPPEWQLEANFAGKAHTLTLYLW